MDLNLPPCYDSPLRRSERERKKEVPAKQISGGVLCHHYSKVGEEIRNVCGGTGPLFRCFRLPWNQQDQKCMFLEELKGLPKPGNILLSRPLKNL